MDGWQRSKLHEAAWRWSTAEEEEEEGECFAAVEAASFSCTTTGDRLIRCGSDRGESDDGKRTGLFRILIGAKQNKKKTQPTTRFTHPKPILKFQISNKNKVERKIRKGIHKPLYSYCIYMPLRRPRKKKLCFYQLFLSLSLSFYLSPFTHKRIPTLSLSLSIHLYLSPYILLP